MNEKSSTSDATPVPGGPKRRESQTQMLVSEIQRLRRLLQEEIEKAIGAVRAETKTVAESVARSVANDVAQDVVQNALEAYQGDDDEGLQAEFGRAIEASFSSSPPADEGKTKRRPSRVRLAESDARPGTKATARAGNNHIPVEIVSGPFMVNGKALYKVRRLTKGKDFTGGLKPLRDLFVFTEEDAESLHSTTPPSRRRPK